MAIDYRDVARRVSEILASQNLVETCYMSYVCFYICEHGMRLEKSMAAAILTDTVDVTHRHFDVLQIHRADNIVSPERGPIFVLLKQDTRSIFSLKRIFDGALL